MEKEFSVSVVNDELAEDTESFEIKLVEPAGGVELGEDNSVVINILTNDNAHGIVSFSQVIEFILLGIVECIFSDLGFNITAKGVINFGYNLTTNSSYIGESFSSSNAV